MPMQGSFDATAIAPEQSMGAHPVGIHDAQITNTEIKPTSKGDGGMFVVEFTTPLGRISNRYNIWNQSAQAVEIANKQLSALCHATGIFKLDWTNDAAVLRGARCKIEVGKQKDSEYVEVKKVFDANGHEPGRGPAAAPTPAAQSGWGQPQAAPAAAPANAPNWGAPSAAPAATPAWGANAQNTPPANPPADSNAAPAWSQGPASAPGGAPPWANNGR